MPSISSLLCACCLFLFFQQAQGEDTITIATGSPTGLYFRIGNGICSLLHQSVQDKEKAASLRCVASSTYGSIYNLNQLKAQQTDFAIAQSDWLHYAFTGTNPYVEHNENLRAVFSLHSQAYHLVVSQTLQQWDDLHNKVLSLGYDGSPQHFPTQVLITLQGTKKEDFKALKALPARKELEAFCTDSIHGFSALLPLGHERISQAINQCNGQLLFIQPTIIQQLIDAYPYYGKISIPKGTYNPLHQKIETFGLFTTLITSKDVKEEIVYLMTKTVMEHLSFLKSLDTSLSYLAAQSMSREGIAVPLHKGALKYYEEIGLLPPVPPATEP